MADYIANTVWGYCFICYKGTPRPDNEIRQDTILSPFLCSIANASLEDAKRVVTSMSLNKNLEAMLDNKIIGGILDKTVWLCRSLAFTMLLFYLCNLVTPIYKPNNVECVDISFESQTIDKHRQDFIRKKMLGVHANLTWYDNDIRLDVLKTNGTSESIIFTKVGGDLYLHNGLYDSKTYLYVKRNLLGWITSIELQYFDYENNQYELPYKIKLK